MLRRYRTLNNDTEVNVDGVRLRAGDDGVFVVEAGSRAEDVLIAGGAISAHLFNLIFDDTGSLISIIRHRQDTVANLNNTQLNPGEVALATDAALIFANRQSVAAVGTMYARGAIEAFGANYAGPNIVAANTDYIYSIDSAPIDPYGILGGATFGAGVISPPTYPVDYMEVSGVISFPYNASATKYVVAVQTETAPGAGTYTDAGVLEWPATTNLGATQHATTVPFNIVVPINSGDGKKRRVVCRSDAAVGQCNNAQTSSPSLKVRMFKSTY
jgi:hypothetical protein